jgi:hypothetical protein
MKTSKLAKKTSIWIPDTIAKIIRGYLPNKTEKLTNSEILRETKRAYQTQTEPSVSGTFPLVCRRR